MRHQAKAWATTETHVQSCQLPRAARVRLGGCKAFSLRPAANQQGKDWHRLAAGVVHVLVLLLMCSKLLFVLLAQSLKQLGQDDVVLTLHGLKVSISCVLSHVLLMAHVVGPAAA